MRLLATPNFSASTAITAALALPLSGGALTATLSAQPSRVRTAPATPSREALGWTLRVNVTPPGPTRKNAASSIDGEVGDDAPQDQLDQIDDQQEDQRREVE